MYVRRRSSLSMTRRVLVPIDGSPHADAALEYACTAFADAEITVLFVLDPFGYYEERDGFPDRLDDWDANLEKRADRPFEEAAEHGVEIDTATEQGRPDRAIVAHAAGISRASFWGAFEDRICDLRANQNA